jgi:hypothetical protein
LLAGVTVVGLAGCSDDANGEYKAFNEIPDEAPASEDVVDVEVAPAESDEVASVDSQNDVNVEQASDADSTSSGAKLMNVPSDQVSENKTSESATGDNAAVAKAETSDDGLLEETGTREEVVMEARDIKLLVTEKTFVRDKETKALRVSYDDIDLLKVLNMEPVPVDAETHFPDWLKQLDGKQVRIRGFMYPTYRSTDLTGFMLARDNDICCFRRNPEIYDVFVVRLAEGEKTDYIEGRPFDVVGTFHIETEAEDGELFQLYHISEARVLNK